MENSILFHFLTSHQYFGYVIVFLGMVIEGDFLLFMTAFLAHSGFFNPPTVFLLAYIGVIVGDISWYYLGVKAQKYPFVHKLLGKITLKTDRHLENRTFRTLLISKFVYGFHHTILMRAGSLGLPLRKYIKSDVVASFVWLSIIWILGSASSASFFLVKRYVHLFEIGLLIALILFFLIEHYLISGKLKEKI